MKLLKFILVVIGINSVWLSAMAAGLTIHAAEVGIGKFHRLDNSVHAYQKDNVWSPFVLAVDKNAEDTFTVENADGSVTIFFSSLEALIESAVKVAQQRGEKLSVLNINAHGMPGGMWFPADEIERKSNVCADWRKSAAAPDNENYEQYYSAISYFDIMQIRDISEIGGEFECVTGLPAWQKIIGRHPNFKSILTNDFQLHLLSCVVGLGSFGDTFAKGLAQLLLSTPQGRVETSLMYGLGDRSIPTGMAFWDYQNDQQLERDNNIYPAHRKDSEIQQRGTIRVTTLNASLRSESFLIQDADYMFLNQDTRTGVKAVSKKLHTWLNFVSRPVVVRIPGTTYYTQAKINN